MTTIILVIHLLIALALVGVVLLQRSEGGALGIGGGGGGAGGGAMFSSRGAANVLTRATAVLAAAFFVTSITLTIMARQDLAPRSVFDEGIRTEQRAPEAPRDVLPRLPGGPTAPQVPQ
jgi:preprotein translocase subunit SecG